ncbi:MAG: WYL domain-containing protein [Lachnospiraceae bacterium]|nr:WYL domain-containing protein [Lachnospiraceae bacterium]
MNKPKMKINEEKTENIKTAEGKAEEIKTAEGKPKELKITKGKPGNLPERLKNVTIKEEESIEEKQKKYKHDDKDKMFNVQGQTLVAFAMRKYYIGEKKAATANEICNKLNDLFSTQSNAQIISKRQVERIIERFVEAGDDHEAGNTKEKKSDMETEYDVFASLLGGVVKEAGAGAANIRNRKYYLEPLMKEETQLILNNLLICAPYISPSEKNKMIKELMLVTPGSIDTAALNPYQGAVSMNFSLPGKNKRLTTRVIPILHNAITRGLKLKITYGKYTLLPGKKLEFNERSGEDTIINPYTMFFHKGRLYLLLTIDGDKEKKIYHYRVDRILKIDYIDKEGNDQKSIKSPDGRKLLVREPIPESLAEYFADKAFNYERYTQRFPAMMYNKTEKRVDLTFVDCIYSHVQVLVDAFGTGGNVSIKNMPCFSLKDDRNEMVGSISPKDRETNQSTYVENSKEMKYLVQIRNVDYGNAKFFAMSNSFLHLAGPEELIKDIREEYAAKIQEYNKILQIKSEE